MPVSDIIKSFCGKEISECSDKELYVALAKTCEKLNAQREHKPKSPKKLYYISAEFLIGRLLSNNLINLGVYDEVKEFLSLNGRDLGSIEESEAEPSLGNGGLGRLAACFLDSVATLGLNGDGLGLNYRFGLFKQVFEKNLQTEIPNPWMSDCEFIKKTKLSFNVEYDGFDLNSDVYDIDIVGYDGTTNKLHLFDTKTVDEGLVKDNINFDKRDITKNLTLFLYPDDSDYDGKLLRLYQQYFLVSSAAQYIVAECEQKGCRLYDLPDYAVIQINDTHPSLIIPELIRILTSKGIGFDVAVEAVSRTCAYTNHTILAEALETWNIDSLKKVVPKLVPIIEVLDDRVRRKFKNEFLNIIDQNDNAHMAKMDIHFCFSTNGVAKLHTEILKNSELNEFYKVYHDRFNNKTNGITFRRWLIKSNPELTNFIEELIGEGFKKDASELEKLLKYKDDKDVLAKLKAIKHKNKANLCRYFKKTNGIELNEKSIFDMQIKRLHEYKRQQLNVLYLINLYLDIKSGKLPQIPVTAFFGAKAAPAYTIAKDIIHLILCLQNLVRLNPEVQKYLDIVMVENYNVTWAEHLIPACDITEQISLASKEASGTGNMKFMLNGAITLGTEDGANVEIHNLVGDDCIYIFGDSSQTVIDRYRNHSYNAREYYEKNPTIKRAVDFICSNEMLKVGNSENLQRLKNELINKDWFMTFPDFDSYTECRNKAYQDIQNDNLWAKKMLVNIAKSGYFSSDRTVKEYNRDIWKL